MTLLAQRLLKVNPSLTLTITKKAAQLKSLGKNIISLGAGEPDFDTPYHIKEAAINAINEGHTKYTNVNGILELRQAISKKLERENNLKYDPNQIIVSSGAKQVIYNLFLATINPNDEVIIPIPYWVSYPDIVNLAEGKSVFIECDNNFKLTPEKLKIAINKNTKWLILNYPNNPTGVSYSKQELRKLAEILILHPNVHIMCDDIYEHILYDNLKFYTFAEVAPELKERIFVINSLSKGYAMTGWRIGYGAGNQKLIDAMSIIQSQSTTNACSISQIAAVTALNGKQDFIKEMTNKFQIRRNLALEILNKTPGIICHKPEGAFYLFPSFKELTGKKTSNNKIIQTSNDFCDFLLDEAEVAAVPGIAFGIEGYFRISYATSDQLLEEACLRIKKACANLIN